MRRPEHSTGSTEEAFAADGGGEKAPWVLVVVEQTSQGQTGVVECGRMGAPAVALACQGSSTSAASMLLMGVVLCP